MNTYGQTDYFEHVVRELSSNKYAGRGYTNEGMDKAVHYLLNEFKKIGLHSYNQSYFQEVQFPVNVIENATLKIDGKNLDYGKDFIVKPSSKSVKKVKTLKNYIFNVKDYVKNFESKEAIKKFILSDYQQQLDKNVILPPLDTKIDSMQKYYKQWSNIYENDINNDRAIFRFTSDSLTSSLSQRQAGISEFIIKSKYYHSNVKINDFSIQSNFKKSFNFKNLIGYIDGENNDSTVVISAHYDHLGQVGSVIFPGASDNASGTAMVLELAKYYAVNKPKYRIAFMLFGAEEAGIVGSYHYVESPLFPLNQIKFLVNLDIMGAGEDGIQVVNGTKYKEFFNQIVTINNNKKYLKEIKVRGESCNSDHCPFDKKGVPSFFIYTLGGKGNYHNVYDTYENLELHKSRDVKQLLIDFITYL